MCQIPFDRLRPEKLFQYDVDHLCKHGFGRSFAICSLLGIEELGFFPSPDGSRAGGKKKRLENIFNHFDLWRSSTGNSFSLAHFTEDNCHMKHRYDFPFVGCKMADTMVLMNFIRFKTATLLDSEPKVDELHARPLLECMNQHCCSTIGFFSLLHHGGLWLDKQTGSKVAEHGRMILRSYAWLARYYYDQGKPRYNLIPKLHYFHHLVYGLELMLEKSDLVLSPAAYACSTDEDFVGKLSRWSRRVNIRQTELRTLQRYLVAARNIERRTNQLD